MELGWIDAIFVVTKFIKSLINGNIFELWSLINGNIFELWSLINGYIFESKVW